MAAEDLQAARRRPHVLLQLEEDAVGGIAVRDAVGHVGALDSVPAADTDADSSATRLLSVVQAPAMHRVYAFEDAVLQVIAAKPGRCNVVYIEIAEGGAHHELKVETLRPRVVFRELDTRAVDLEVEEHAVGQVVLPARAVLLLREARQGDRLAVAFQDEPSYTLPRSGERDAALPYGRLAGNAVRPRRTVDNSRAAVFPAFAPEFFHERCQSGLVIHLSVACQAVVARVPDFAGVVDLMVAQQRLIHAPVQQSSCRTLELLWSGLRTGPDG